LLLTAASLVVVLTGTPIWAKFQRAIHRTEKNVDHYSTRRKDGT